MPRFSTREDDTGKVSAQTEDEDYVPALDNAQGWVWQHADNKDQAITQHEEKHDQWSNDQDNGTEKETY